MMAKRWKVDMGKRNMSASSRCKGWDGCVTVAWLKASKAAEIARRDQLIRDMFALVREEYPPHCYRDIRERMQALGIVERWDE